MQELSRGSGALARQEVVHRMTSIGGREGFHAPRGKTYLVGHTAQTRLKQPRGVCCWRECLCVRVAFTGASPSGPELRGCHTSGRGNFRVHSLGGGRANGCTPACPGFVHFIARRAVVQPLARLAVGFVQ